MQSPPPPVKTALIAGFTLIEMSIVLVIIGLIVGSVLVGQDLIRAAEVRATISQVEKYNTAVNTFRGKFGYLPGDINAQAANTFGFAARGPGVGMGDGNGYIEGMGPYYGADNVIECGEPFMVWVDLSSAVAGNLIEGGFNTAVSVQTLSADITGTYLNLYLPQAKLGRGNYFYVHEGAYLNGPTWTDLAVNYFGLSSVSKNAASGCELFSTPNIPVAEAYSIDRKVDDGMPQSGNVMAWYVNFSQQYWTDGTNASQTAGEPKPYSGNLSGSSSTCYDNGGNSTSPTQYSLSQNNGAGANCALSFKFQ